MAIAIRIEDLGIGGLGDGEMGRWGDGGGKENKSCFSRHHSSLITHHSSLITHQLQQR
jgi:hypothetical protein